MDTANVDSTSPTSPTTTAAPFSARPMSTFSYFGAPATSPPNPHHRHSVIQHKPSIATLASTRSSFYSNFSVSPSTNTLYVSGQERPLPSRSASAVERIPLRKQVAKQNAQKQQQLRRQQQQFIQQHQPKKSLPLFPTIRTRGATSVQNLLQPVDISQIKLLPIEFSYKIAIDCIEEIRLRGLKHRHLFRNAFYSPSVEAALSLMMDPAKGELFSVKTMRLDTVAGLLITTLSRTNPPLIPVPIQELFQKPNGYFFFELLGMMQELNRFLFVEVLELCCELVDHQVYNLLSHSKLAIYPGSCCFGLDEYMPTWDTRYLLTDDRKKFSTTFYSLMYAYRDERDLSAEQLQQKVDIRTRRLEQERLELLTKEHGPEIAKVIMKRESRVALGLPPDSPEQRVPEFDPSMNELVREISLYTGRNERVVADDAISVLNIHLDDHNELVAIVPGKKSPLRRHGKDREDVSDGEENVEKVLSDLRKSVSVATLESYSRSTSSLSSTTVITTSASATRSNLTLPSTVSSESMRTISTARVYPSVVMNGRNGSQITTSSTTSAGAKRHPRAPLRAKSIARFGSIAENLYPKSPGDIFGISHHAIQQRQLQEFLNVARSFKHDDDRRRKRRRSKTVISKRILQMRLQNRILRDLFVNTNAHGIEGTLAEKLPVVKKGQSGWAPSFVLVASRDSSRNQFRRRAGGRHAPLYRPHTSALTRQSSPSSSTSLTLSPTESPITQCSQPKELLVLHQNHDRHHQQIAALASGFSLRRSRTRQSRKELEAYQAQGLSVEEAEIHQEQNQKRQRRRERRVRKLIHQAKEEAASAAAEEEAAAAAAASRLGQEEDMTMEETEILEAFDYLSDQEFEEFMALAGLTMQDVDRIRQKSATMALNQVSKDIESAAAVGRSNRIEQDEWVPVEQAYHGSNEKAIHRPAIEKEGVIRVDETVNQIGQSALTRMSSRRASSRGMPAPAQSLDKTALYLPHMSSMDQLLKHASAVGDNDLRCYPVEPSSSRERSPMVDVQFVLEIEDQDVEQDDETEIGQLGQERKSEESVASSILTNASATTSSTETMVDSVPEWESFPYVPPPPPSSSSASSTFKDLTSPTDKRMIASVSEQMFVFETVEENEVEENEMEDEDASELEELLASMSEEDRIEYLRLSGAPDLVATTTTKAQMGVY
ncbi:hypothetical protein BGW38_009781 [Lunasporangiospora selenospora]|uniref:Uncharacterized protein n=1 Tax=Lunasporangiospora selenospora TaxID=979761 RepID=A0A9P6FXJ6_9FUNG|nr:hypothetical protein BGW38_009781 [Lunasporangiospora selenospora]